MLIYINEKIENDILYKPHFHVPLIVKYNGYLCKVCKIIEYDEYEGDEKKRENIKISFSEKLFIIIKMYILRL